MRRHESQTIDGGKKLSAKGNGEAIPPVASNGQEVVTDDAVEDLKERFHASFYEMVADPMVLKGLRDLLLSEDEGRRSKAWEMVLEHGIPVGKDAEKSQTPRFQVVLNVPRPGDPIPINLKGNQTIEIGAQPTQTLPEN